MEVKFGKGKATVTLQHNGRIRNYFFENDKWRYSCAGTTLMVRDENEKKFLNRLMEAYANDAPAIFA